MYAAVLLRATLDLPNDRFMVSPWARRFLGGANEAGMVERWDAFGADGMFPE